MEMERLISRALMGDEALEKLAPRTRRATAASHWPRAVMMERAAYLKEMARFSSGVEAETVRNFAGHKAIMLFRSRSGQAEVHAHHADVFIVLAGSATLVTGGQLVNARQTEPGELRSDTLSGGTELALHAGDIAHVPAGVPHQMLIRGEQTISCFVLKIDWVEEESEPNRSGK